MIPVAKPWIGEAEAEAVRRPLLSGWVTQGPEVAAFEREFARLSGRSMPALFPAARPLCIWRCWRLGFGLATRL